MNTPRALELVVHRQQGGHVLLTFYPHDDDATPEQVLDRLFTDANRFVAAIKNGHYDLTIVAPSSVNVEIHDDTIIDVPQA